MEQYNKLSSEMYKHLVQQTVQQKKQEKSANKVQKSLYYKLEYTNEDVNFIFCLFNKTRTQRKFTFSINFIVQQVVHYSCCNIC